MKPALKVITSTEIVQITSWTGEFTFEDGLVVSVEVELRAIPLVNLPTHKVQQIVVSCKGSKSTLDTESFSEFFITSALARAVKMEDEDRETWGKLEEKAKIIHKMVVDELWRYEDIQPKN